VKDKQSSAPHPLVPPRYVCGRSADLRVAGKEVKLRKDGVYTEEGLGGPDGVARLLAAGASLEPWSG